MSQVKAVVERTVAAPVEQVRAAVADYAGARKAALTSHFSEYDVREGGTGAGTLVHWNLAATSKRVRDVLAEVSSPKEGTLVESDRNSSMITTWTVDGSAESSTIRVVTTWDGAGGIGGFFERTFAPGGLRRIYDELLTNIAGKLES
jgi:hypothetical protein